jgi:glycosyltransferase involved in cell wall biosynthesis
MQHKFVIVIPSYNNIKYCRKNLLSALNQDYLNFRIIYTDDCSTDGTVEEAEKIITEFDYTNRVTLVRNQNRLKAMANSYNMAHSCQDDEIVVFLDGDDWLYDTNVLNRLNEEYNKDIWLTYGQYIAFSNNSIGCSQRISESIIRSNNFRRTKWCSSHLRTYYAGLFKRIRKEDLMYNGQFVESASDLATMFPLLEMAGTKQSYIPDVLYVYNDTSTLNDFRVNFQLQRNIEKKIRSGPRYKPITSMQDPLVDVYYRRVDHIPNVHHRPIPAIAYTGNNSSTVSRVYRPTRRQVLPKQNT